jgi:hypothetical protein
MAEMYLVERGDPGRHHLDLAILAQRQVTRALWLGEGNGASGSEDRSVRGVCSDGLAHDAP